MGQNLDSSSTKFFLDCLTILLSRWDLKSIVPAITDGSLELELTYPFVENTRSIPKNPIALVPTKAIYHSF